MNETIEAAAERYVRKFFAEQMPNTYHFHNLNHTIGVVNAALTIALEYPLSEEDHSVLILAAWFHDTGYSRIYEGHEAASVEIATNFLREQKASESFIEKVSACIMATKMPQSPYGLTAEILCDADLLHLGTDDFMRENKLLRRELIDTNSKKISKKSWRKSTIKFLKDHQYFTSYAKTYADPVKVRNLKNLLVKPDKQNKAETVVAAAILPEQQDYLANALASGKKFNGKEKPYSTERGVATMFRIMSAKHVSLSQMADSKANIMISLNTIVLSILVSTLLGKLQFYPQFIIPSIIMVIVCLCAVVYSIMVTRPNVNKGVFTEEEIHEKKVNLLFFGNFFNMELQDYEWGMKEMMNNNDFLYGSMIKDIYFHGKVLAKKYHYLRISYNIFMYGLIFAIFVFGVAALLGKN
ncbi:Pycsar system effector family protein [Flavihumibacter fluvii]|uniref:Pycsar system effector family protein n=1 Tax=Flavihumibacter fluvii TaxID=2838157 RepID=UPI001BDEB977|nr:Pycsar system effector family protein [Flavihumibacter fluvii]ULQ52309.1 DUF5706 domain-containing protein [Flavihumibacter fluvii]